MSVSVLLPICLLNNFSDSFVPKFSRTSYILYPPSLFSLLFYITKKRWLHCNGKKPTRHKIPLQSEVPLMGTLRNHRKIMHHFIERLCKFKFFLLHFLHQNLRAQLHLTCFFSKKLNLVLKLPSLPSITYFLPWSTYSGVGPSPWPFSVLYVLRKVMLSTAQSWNTWKRTRDLDCRRSFLCYSYVKFRGSSRSLQEGFHEDSIKCDNRNLVSYNDSKVSCAFRFFMIITFINL